MIMKQQVKNFFRTLDLEKVRMCFAACVIFFGLIMAADEAPALNLTALCMEKLTAVVVIAIGALMMPKRHFDDDEKGGEL